jgi:hypothetical protein
MDEDYQTARSMERGQAERLPDNAVAPIQPFAD